MKHSKKLWPCYLPSEFASVSGSAAIHLCPVGLLSLERQNTVFQMYCRKGCILSHATQCIPILQCPVQTLCVAFSLTFSLSPWPLCKKDIPPSQYHSFPLPQFWSPNFVCAIFSPSNCAYFLNPQIDFPVLQKWLDIDLVVFERQVSSGSPYYSTILTPPPVRTCS